jgi:hypothetical protein
MPPANSECSERVYAGPVALAHPRVTRALEWTNVAIFVAMPILSLISRSRDWFAVRIALMAAAATVAALVWQSRRATLRAGEIWRDRDGAITVRRQGGRAVTFAAGALRGAVAVPRFDGEQIEIALEDGRELTLEPRRVAEGKRVLSHLGVDPSRRRSRVSLGGDADARWRAFVGIIGFGLLLPLVPVGWLSFLGIAVCLALVAQFWRSGRAAAVALVGLDGVEIRWRGGARFVPLAGVASARVKAGAGVELELVDGTYELLVPDYRGSNERVRALAAMVREAVRARERLGEPASAPGMLERGERSFAQWTEALRGLARGAYDYRVTAVPVEDFSAVLEDPDATTEQRIGAALVLDGTGDPEARTRIRLAADTSASPRMRVVLAAIAEAAPYEDAIADALAGDAPAEQHRQRRPYDPS